MWLDSTIRFNPIWFESKRNHAKHSKPIVSLEYFNLDRNENKKIAKKTFLHCLIEANYYVYAREHSKYVAYRLLTEFCADEVELLEIFKIYAVHAWSLGAYANGRSWFFLFISNCIFVLPKHTVHVPAQRINIKLKKMLA